MTHSLNCDNCTPRPLLSSTVHQQHRKSLDCNAFSSVPSARDDSETGNGRIRALSARYFNVCDVLASIAEFTAELFLIGVMINVQTLLAQIFILDRRFLKLWFFLRLKSYVDGSFKIEICGEVYIRFMFQISICFNFSPTPAHSHVPTNSISTTPFLLYIILYPVFHS